MKSTKRQKPHEKAAKTGRTAETLFKALTKQVGARWGFRSFRGPRGAESRGVVDVLAVRRNTSDPHAPPLRAYDLFDINSCAVEGWRCTRPRPG